MAAAAATPIVSGVTFQEVFEGMSSRLMRELEKVEFTTPYPTDAVVFVEEQQPRGVFVVLRGRVKLSVSSRDGKTLILRIAEAGEVLGISACVSNHQYEATAETLEPAEIAFVKRADLLHLMQTNNDLALWLAEKLSDEYSFTCREVRNLMLVDSARGKLARFLVEYLDDSLKSPEDVEQALGVPVLGFVADMRYRRKEAEQVYVARQPRSPSLGALATTPRCHGARLSLAPQRAGRAAPARAGGQPGTARRLTVEDLHADVRLPEEVPLETRRREVLGRNPAVFQRACHYCAKRRQPRRPM